MPPTTPSLLWELDSQDYHWPLVWHGKVIRLKLSKSRLILAAQVPLLDWLPMDKRHWSNHSGGDLPNQTKLEEIAEGGGIVEELQTDGVLMPDTGGIMLGWWNVRDVLFSRVRQEPDKIKLHMGWMVQEIVDGETCVTAKFQKLNDSDSAAGEDNPQEELYLKGCILVGADGVNSAVRDFLKLPPAKYTNVTTWRTRLTIDSQAEEPSDASDLLRPLLDILIAPLGVRMRGNLNYALFNFHEKRPGTMALLVNFNQRDDPTREISPRSSPWEVFRAVVEDESELKEITAVLQLADQDGLHHPVALKVIERPKEDNAGWGGKGRITLVGDSAHGMRPASGQGGSMAFEDSAVLCRVLRKLRLSVGESFSKTPTSKGEIEEALRGFENTRLPRVRKLWWDQWERSESTYNNVRMKPWSKEFADWIFDGV